jgi:hypothetical protein
MHAYSSLDPVFRAINKKGQEETDGALGDFCVRCHAPVAVALGLTEDGLNLDEVPSWAQGVTCYFCHSVESVEGEHNNPLVLATDGVIRGAYADPVANKGHDSAYSALVDGDALESANLCGPCHDIVTPAPHRVHLERTFGEWKDSLFSKLDGGDMQTCANCHMDARDDVAAEAPGVFLREVHDHRMVGVDVALTDFPDMEAQLQGIQKDLNTTVLANLCVTSFGAQHFLAVRLENMGAGHSWPSGASHDRRAWVEVIAYDAEDNILYQTGAVDEGVALADLDDPDLWALYDRAYDAQGEPTHLFWEVASIESELLPAPPTSDITDPHFIDIHRTREFNYAGEAPARVTLRVRIRAMPLDLLNELVDEGYLAPDIPAAMPTFTLTLTVLEWTPNLEGDCVLPVHL